MGREPFFAVQGTVTFTYNLPRDLTARSFLALAASFFSARCGMAKVVAPTEL
jgi:hypothetical protein